MAELIINSEIQTINATKKFGDNNINFNFQKDDGSFVNNIINFSVNKVTDTEDSTDIATPIVPMMGISGNFNIETNKIFLINNFEVTDDNYKLFKEIVKTCQEIVKSK